MKNTIKASMLASAMMALSSIGAYAAPAVSAVSGAITLNATVQTDDAVDCSATGTVNFGSALVQGVNSTGQTISCNVTDNDSAGVNMYVYGTVALTGTTASNTIALTNISFSPTGTAYTPFSDVSTATGVTGAMGGEVYAGLASGLNATAENFFLQLAVPANQAADTYSTTVVVGIVPATS